VRHAFDVPHAFVRRWILLSVQLILYDLGDHLQLSPPQRLESFRNGQLLGQIFTLRLGGKLRPFAHRPELGSRRAAERPHRFEQRQRVGEELSQCGV
jgi:hypothetical protein